MFSSIFYNSRLQPLYFKYKYFKKQVSHKQKGVPTPSTAVNLLCKKSDVL